MLKVHLANALSGYFTANDNPNRISKMCEILLCRFNHVTNETPSSHDVPEPKFTVFIKQITSIRSKKIKFILHVRQQN